MSPIQMFSDCLDACQAEEKDSPSEFNRETLRYLEEGLAVMPIQGESDVFVLMYRLADKQLDPSIRERLAGRIGRAAPFLASHSFRMQELIAAREESVRNSRQEQEKARHRLDMALSMLHAAQNAGSPDGSPEDAKALSLALGNIIAEVVTARATMTSADSILDKDFHILMEIMDLDHFESQLFSQAQTATIQ